MSPPRRPGGDDRRPDRRDRRAAAPSRRPSETKRDGGADPSQPKVSVTGRRAAPKAGDIADIRPPRSGRPAKTDAPVERSASSPRGVRSGKATPVAGGRAGPGKVARASRDAALGNTKERSGSRRDRPPEAKPTPGASQRRDRPGGPPRSARKTEATPAPPPGPAAAARREPQRIAKLLARAGIASRREVERMIAEGRVAIDGTVLETPATVIPSLHGVTVDGVAVAAAAPTRLFLFNKPTGFLTTAHDPAGRPTIYDRLPDDLPRVMPVGRLDMNTEGLLLLTTDGGLKRQLELPASGVPRIYRARAYGAVTQEQLEALSEGVEIEGVRYGSIDANLERRTGRNVWIELRLAEGKNREVRRVLEYLDLQVSRLIRVAYGPFVLADLAAGAVAEVRQHDLVAFRQTLK